jgi:hypothetical protein
MQDHIQKTHTHAGIREAKLKRNNHRALAALPAAPLARFKYLRMYNPWTSPGVPSRHRIRYH